MQTLYAKQAYMTIVFEGSGYLTFLGEYHQKENLSD